MEAQGKIIGPVAVAADPSVTQLAHHSPVFS